MTGGGTAGHILPAIEFLQAYRREFHAEGYFIGCAAGLEQRLVPASGERLELIPGLPWGRQGWRGKLRAVTCVPAGILAARRILQREKTDLVIGTGGYAAFGTCVAAYSLRIPVVIHEANAEAGLANRMAARFAALVCLGFSEAAGRIHGPVEITGIPIGTIAPAAHSSSPPWRFLVLGGSEGSPILNREAPPLFALLQRRGVPFRVRHISGFGDAAAIAGAYAAAGIDAEVDSYVADMGPVYAGATLAIASAGARTAAELSAAGIPSLLVPLPGAANDHQSANARACALRTGAKVVAESEWDGAALAEWLHSVVSDAATLRNLRERSASWSNTNAALHVVRSCEQLLTQASARRAGAVDRASASAAD